MVLYQRRIACPLLVKLFAIVLIVLHLSSCNVFSNNEILPYYNSQDLTPNWNTKKEHRITAFNFVDQNGKNFGSKSLKDKIYIANFFFTTCPGICPKMTKCFKVLQDSISLMNHVELVSFSVMPWIDTVNKLKKYGEENGVNPAKWHLLTGDKSIIYSLGRSSFFADNNKLTDSTTFLHTDKMYLIDKSQQIRGVYNATNMDDISRVLTDIKALK
ncbi:MAG: SCO family protein [Chitinophagia bacterium]|jgi:protein SCO1/2|nr:SCO family protein [Chitinophagia bacterium]